MDVLPARPTASVHPPRSLSPLPKVSANKYFSLQVVPRFHYDVGVALHSQQRDPGSTLGTGKCPVISTVGCSQLMSINLLLLTGIFFFIFSFGEIV